MDKLRNIKHRLSMSVDKLSPSRRSKSQQRKSVPLGSTPCSDGDIPDSVRTSRADSRPTSAAEVIITSGSRPNSYCEPDADESTSGEWLDAIGAASLPDPVDDIKESEEVASSPSPIVEDKPLKRPTSSSVEGGGSLMSEVMKEVEKITDITETLKTKRQKVETEAADEVTVSVSDKKALLDVSTDGESQEPSEQVVNICDETLPVTEVTHRQTAGRGIVHRKAMESTSTTLSVSSTCRAESLTSGYFSDSDVTLSDVRCDSGYLKSAFTSVASENTEQSKSAFTSVPSEITEHKSAFTLVKSETTGGSISACTSGTSDDQDQGQSAFTSIMSGQQTTSSAFTAITPEKTESTVASAETTEETSETSTAASTTSTTTTTQKSKTGVTKKESIYSRIMRKKDSSKEPIYAKIKPKLTIETSFQPIEPNTAKNTSQVGSAGVVKPEPIYSVVKPRDPGAPLVPLSPVSAPITPGSPFALVGTGAPALPKKVEPIYSKIQPKDSRSNTLPREPIYSKVRKESGTLPRDPSHSKAKSKEPIYTKPLPLTPKEEAERKRDSFYSQTSTSSDYGKVTVRVGEITPSRPAVITINNPGYAAPSGLPSPISPSSPTSPSSPLTSSAPIWPTVNNTPAVSPPKHSGKTVSLSPTTQVKVVERIECAPPSKSLEETPEPRPLVASDSSLIESSDTESTGRNKLSQLVEELALELEAVSRRIGANAEIDDDCKKEVLAKLLSTYDIPKNLRRVEEADEDAVLEAEQALVPGSISMDELRYVDDNEDNAETVYADVPDYSQDEFVIALDDENDPRYASLTRKFRENKSWGDSPGRISRKTANVYANALNVVTALRVLINSKSTRAATVINKMGTLARPYAQRVQGTISDTTWIQRVIYHKSVRKASQHEC
ncbi:proteoglycan 4-like [Homarus americanus]|uniref:Uncharacterized protein n=1 Tax=Homarus americanus TaxID=6706 RepID=A0A8J5K554_HOMAM|nr:proteoglycan 4-like [Homarus americanus]KAG7169621.1 hypothetical protein Hamer_G013220 [Homarus americanus]